MDMTSATLAKHPDRPLSAGTRLARMDRALKLMSACNKLILNAGDELQLLKAACRAIVRLGGYGFAAAAYAENDAAKSVRPVATSASGADFIVSADANSADGENGRGPMDTAIRTGRAVVTRELMTDPSFARARKWAIANKYRSCAALPLSSEGKVFGVLAVYAGRPDAFDPDEIELLTELAGSLGYGVAARRAMRARVALDIAERQKTERELAFNTAILATEHEMSPDGILVVDRRGRVVSFNRRFVELMHIPPELIEAGDDRPLLDFGAKEMADPEAFLVRVRHLYAHPEEKGFDLLELKDGRAFDRYTAPAQMPDGAYAGRVWFFRDITNRLHAKRMLERINRTLKTLSAGNEALVRTDNEPELLEKMCRVAVEIGGYRLAWIGLAEEDEGKSVRPVAWAGDNPECIKTASISWAGNERGGGPTGAAIRTGQPQIDQNLETDPVMVPCCAEFMAMGYRSSIALPLKNRSRTFGAFTIYAGESDAFGEDEVKLLVELAEDLSYGIASLRDRVAREESVQRLRKSMDATVRAIASTLELRDPYTAGHQRRVGDLAAAIGREMGIPEEEIEGIYLAGVVHDIGKINVPAEILGRPGKLTRLEFEIIQTHAQTGHDIVKGVEFPWPIAKMILQHHERLDGSGYPNGLKADDILLGAKILAVADVVEAMTAHRPYRAALGLEAALAEIENGKGRLYEPQAVDMCVKLLRSGAFTFAGTEASTQPDARAHDSIPGLTLAELR